MKKTYLSTYSNPIGLNLFAGALVLGLISSSVSAEDKISSKVTTKPSAALNSNESRAISLAAVGVIKHAFDARNALDSSSTDDALNEITQGLKLINIVKKVLPKSTVSTEISSGDLVYKDEDIVSPRFATILDEVGHIDVLGPLTQLPITPKKVTNAKTDKPLKKDKVSAENKKKRGQGITFAGWEESTVRLDIALSEGLLKLAKEKIGDKKIGEAKRILVEVAASGLVFDSIVETSPIERAAENIKFAHAALKAGKHQDASTALSMAADGLKRYEESADKKQAEKARSLREEMSKLNKDLGDTPSVSGGEKGV